VQSACISIKLTSVLPYVCAFSSQQADNALPGGGQRVMVGVRCAIKLEVPVADGGQQLVPDSYLAFLAAEANKKFDLNTIRITRLQHLFTTSWGSPPATAVGPCRLDDDDEEGDGVKLGGLVPAGSCKSSRQLQEAASHAAAVAARQCNLLQRIAEMEDAVAVGSSPVVASEPCWQVLPCTSFQEAGADFLERQVR
jgi:Methyltransferase TYW3